MRILVGSENLTADSKGPPDHRLSTFKLIVSCPAGPNDIAPRRPLPRGYAERMISVAVAGEVDQNDLAWES